MGEAEGLSIVRGELSRPESYRGALRESDTVVHLAAATGKASATEHHEVNVVGTQKLVEECQRCGVRRLMFVSSIAVKFSDQRDYPYARTKSEAEQVILQSGLDTVIVRPAIVAGRGSPVISSLARLASLPLLPLFGGGHARIQPIHVEDLARLILLVLKDDPFEEKILEFGGPEVISIGEFLRRLRARSLERAGPAVTVPLAPVLPVLRMLEATVGSGLLPLTAGQLSTFRFDGTIDSNRFHERLRGQLRGISDMIDEYDLP